MTDLVVRDLTMEYSSGGYAVRPIDALDLDVADRRARAAARRERLRQDDAALDAGRDSSRRRPGRSAFGDIEVTDAHGPRLWPSTGATRSASCSRRSTSSRASPHAENVQVALQRGEGAASDEARARAEELLEQVGPRRPHAPPPGGPVGRAAAARRHRPRARARPAARSSPTNPPRTSTTSRSTACSGCSASSRDPGGSSSCRHARRAAAPARRPRRRAHAARRRRRRVRPRSGDARARARCCSSRATGRPRLRRRGRRDRDLRACRRRHRRARRRRRAGRLLRRARADVRPAALRDRGAGRRARRSPATRCATSASTTASTPQRSSTAPPTRSRRPDQRRQRRVTASKPTRSVGRLRTTSSSAPAGISVSPGGLTMQRPSGSNRPTSSDSCTSFRTSSACRTVCPSSSRRCRDAVQLLAFGVRQEIGDHRGEAVRARRGREQRAGELGAHDELVGLRALEVLPVLGLHDLDARCTRPR